MTLMISIASLFCFLLAVSIVLVCRKLVVDANVPEDGDWVRQLSPTRYNPMARLLDEDEYARLKAHPAINAKMLRNLRSRRITIYRGYLRTLSADYGRVCKTTRLLMVQSAQDRPDLATLLVRQRINFT